MLKLSATLFTLLLQVLISNAFAQSKQQVYAGIQSLLNKVIGEKFASFSGQEKITAQAFTEKTISFNSVGLGQYGSEWVTMYLFFPGNF